MLYFLLTVIGLIMDLMLALILVCVCVFAEFEAFYVFDKMSYGLCRL